MPGEVSFDQDAPEDTSMDNRWADPDDLDLNNAAAVPGGDWDVGLDLGIDLGDIPVEAVPEEKGFTLSMGDTAQTKWLKKRKLPCDLVAAGEFEEALGLLRRRLGIVNAAPLEPLFKEIYWATCSSLPGLPQMPSLNWPLLSQGHIKSKDPTPVIFYTVARILDRVREAHKLTTQGKFAEVLVIFRGILQAIPLSAANDAREEQQLTEIIEMCREYVNLCRLGVARKGAEGGRMIELAAFMTCLQLQPTHLMLTLQLAMSNSFKAANYITAASFAKRLIQGNFPNANKDLLAKAKQLVTVCEQRASDAHAIDFDAKAPVASFRLCSGSLSPMKATAATVSCPYCTATYDTSYKGKLCHTCQLCEIGANTLGIQLRPI